MTRARGVGAVGAPQLPNAVDRDHEIMEMAWQLGV